MFSRVWRAGNPFNSNSVRLNHLRGLPLAVQRVSFRSDAPRLAHTSQKRWTPEEDEHLIRRYSEQATRGSIAEELGRSTPSVMHRIYMLGKKDKLSLRRRPYTSPEEDRVLDLLAQGKTAPEIAAALGRSILSVAMFKHKDYQRPNSTLRSFKRVGPKPWQPTEDQLLLHLSAQGTPLKDIANQLGREYSIVRRRHLKLSKQDHKHEETGSESTTTERVVTARRERRKWTREDLQILTELFDRGLTAREVGERMGRPWPSCQSKKRVMQPERGISVHWPQRWTPAELSDLVKLRESPSRLSWDEIAMRLETGRSASACRNRYWIYKVLLKPRD